MRWVSLLVFGALSVPALGSLSQLPPSVQLVGPLTVVHPNDLDTKTAPESLLLLHRRQPNAAASLACSTLHETLATADDLSSTVREHLDFLAYDGQLDSKDSLWVKGNLQESPARNTCSAYSLEHRAVTEVPCTSAFKTLCTQSAPPTTATNRRNVSESSHVAITAGAAQYVGYRDARSFRFLGIRYGEAPTAKTRFLPTRSPLQLGVINATQTNNVCLQTTSSSFSALGETQSEDCLFLNVFTPSLPSPPAAKLKPVGFWIHGGSFVVGSGSQVWYDGGNFASRGDVVFVTINYRLDILGTLADNHGAGQAGISDAILALRWVHDNIAAFGGDPEKVTLMGESAGALAVAAILSSPAASGLFHAAVSESSLNSMPWDSHAVYPDVLTPAIAKAFGADNATAHDDPVAFLRSLPADDFSSGTSAAAAGSVLPAAEALMFHTTSVDTIALPPTVGGLIKDQFIYLLGNNTLPNKVPLLIGTNRDEYALVVYASPEIPLDEELYKTLLGNALGQEYAAAVIADGTYALNTSDPDGMRRGVCDAATARAFMCSLRKLISTGLKSGALNANRTFVYRFDWGFAPTPDAPAACFPEAPGSYHPVCHGAEVLPVFGNLNVMGVPYNSTQELQISQHANDVWSSFIRTHSPDVSEQYLAARGSLYAATLERVRKAPFRAINESGTYVFDFEPHSDGPVDPKKCAVFDTTGYAFDYIDNSY